MKILVKYIKKSKKGPPQIKLKEHKYEGNSANEITNLMESKIPYFECHNLEAKRKEIFEIPPQMKGYVKRTYVIK